jgi:hypothetical protein
MIVRPLDLHRSPADPQLRHVQPLVAPDAEQLHPPGVFLLVDLPAV